MAQTLLAKSKAPLLINSCEIDGQLPIPLQQKADEIFEKEQAALAEQGLAEANKEAPPEMFVDANG